MMASDRFGRAMRLPSKLLGQVRVGVGVGAVLLGGCDLVDDAKAEVLGEPVAQAVSEDVSASRPAAGEQDGPEPLLLTRAVGEAVQQAQSKVEPDPLPPVRDLGRPAESRPIPSSESEPFVAYDDGSGTVAAAPPSLARPKIRPRPRPRPSVEPLAVAPDEPCDPGEITFAEALATETPTRTWDSCPACGRG